MATQGEIPSAVCPEERKRGKREKDEKYCCNQRGTDPTGEGSEKSVPSETMKWKVEAEPRLDGRGELGVVGWRRGGGGEEWMGGCSRRQEGGMRERKRAERR